MNCSRCNKEQTQPVHTCVPETPTPTPICPKCSRPMNMGNSPNSEECTETNDDEGLCEAYAKLTAAKKEVEELKGEWCCEKHPEHNWPHDGCGGAGILRSAKIDYLLHQRKQLQKEVTELQSQVELLSIGLSRKSAEADLWRKDAERLAEALKECWEPRMEIEKTDRLVDEALAEHNKLISTQSNNT